MSFKIVYYRGEPEKVVKTYDVADMMRPGVEPSSVDAVWIADAQLEEVRRVYGATFFYILDEKTGERFNGHEDEIAEAMDTIAILNGAKGTHGDN
jgi:hypothetical protein